MRKTSTIRDPDDFFQKEKEWAMAYGTQIKEVCDRFNGLSSAKMRLSNQVISQANNLTPWPHFQNIDEIFWIYT